MGYNMKSLILIALFLYVLNADYKIVVLPQEVNDGETGYFTVIISEIWIYTKIVKDSQVIVDIITEADKTLTKDQVVYSKYYKDSNTTADANLPIFASLGNNKYKCTYDISKDNSDYGLLKIKGRSLGEKLIISVTVIGKGAAWAIVIGCVVVVILLIALIIFLCRKFLSCCRRRY